MARILTGLLYTCTPPATPPRSTREDHTTPPTPPSPQPQEPGLAIQVEVLAERCHFLEQQLEAERQAQTGFLKELSAMREAFQELSASAAETRKQIKLEKTRATKAEKLAQKYEKLKEEAESDLEGEREELQRTKEELEKMKEIGKIDRGQIAKQLKTAAYERYKNQWALLRRLSETLEDEPVLKFGDIPWPMFNSPSKPEDITLEEIEKFLEGCPVDKPGGQKRKATKDWLLVWHPDKFAKWLPYVVQPDKPLVQRGTLSVTQIINEMIKETKR